jgi:SPW repeat
MGGAMKTMRVIPTRVHGMMDYLVGVLLIASPWIFGFADESSTAKWTFIVVGAAVLATSLLTNYELGAIHAIPMHIHLWADAAAGIVLALSPWIFGYADDAGSNAWLPALLIGIVELGTAAMSDPWPTRDDVASHEREMMHRAA